MCSSPESKKVQEYVMHDAWGDVGQFVEVCIESQWDGTFMKSKWPYDFVTHQLWGAHTAELSRLMDTWVAQNY